MDTCTTTYTLEIGGKKYAHLAPDTYANEYHTNREQDRVHAIESEGGSVLLELTLVLWREYLAS